MNDIKKKEFALEDMMPYSDIEITNVNDNRPPLKVMVIKVGIWACLAILVLALVLL
ncbi:MAG: hypothetical protein LBB25_02975 [Holosporaceae bacterium]|nr:hypothetical protein [Holosporaceae bacterium]